MNRYKITYDDGGELLVCYVNAESEEDATVAFWDHWEERGVCMRGVTIKCVEFIKRFL